MTQTTFARLDLWIGSLLLIVLTALPTDVQAQPRSGGFPGGSGFSRGSGLFGTLFRDEAQQELGLSEDQVNQARGISGKARMSREEMQPFSDKIRAAGDDEAQVAAIQAQIAATNEQKAAAAELELKNLIGEEKVTRLRQLNLQFEGSRSLTGNEELQTQLGLSEQQKQQLEAMGSDRNEARRSLFRAPESEREQFDRDWNQKMFGVLTDEQREKWSSQAGEIIVSNGVPGAIAPVPSSAPSTPGPGSAQGAAPGAVAEERDTTPPNISDPLIRPDDPQEGERIVSFAPIASASKPRVVVAQVDTGDAPLLAPSSTESPAEETLKPLPQKETVGFGSLPNAKAQKVSFNFAFAPWRDVLKMFAELSGLTLDLTTTPVGTFNYYDDREYTPVEALDVLNGYLIQKGYLLVRRNQFLVVLNIDQGIPPNVIPDVPLAELKNRGRYELMRIRIPVGGLDPNIAAREVDPLLGPQGKVIPLTTSKSLLITDIGDNLRVIAQLLESVTTEEDPNEVIFQQFVIKTMSASEAESIVEAQFGLTPTPTNISSFTGNDRDRRSSAPTSSSSSGNISITSDRRTNSLLVTAPRGQMKLIESLLASVDVGDKTYDPATDPNINNEPYLRAHPVLNADAREVAKTLSSMLPEGVVINEEGRNRRVHIFGNDEMQEKAAKMIKDLDNDTSDVAVEVFFLNKYDPVSAALMLDAMFINEGEQAPVIEPDSFGRRLMIRATHSQLAQIKALMGPLGETGVPSSSGRGNVRVINTGNRNAAEMLQMLQEVWVQPNPIRVSIPSQRSPIRGEFVPSKLNEPATESEPETAPSAQRPRPGSFQEQLLKDLEQLLTTQTDTESVDDALQAIDEEVQDAIEGRRPVLDLTPSSQRNTATAPAEVTAPAKKPVLDITPASERDNSETPAEGTELEDEALRRLGADATATADGSAPEMVVTLQGDNIVIASDDEEALDQLEELLQSIGMAFPPQKDWTIFYLQSTDATEVAYTIEKLIPDSSVSATTTTSDGSLMGELTAGIMGLGQSVADSSGLSSFTESSTSLRIIPETRLNALFVTGPNHLIAEVEEFLRFLDASELPPSLRDRLPRTIPVEYADVNEVYNIVSDIYKDYLNSGNQGGGGNNRNNPLAALMGQGGGGNTRGGANARPQLAKLTLGVDERTSQLIVSASDALYREIEAMVLKIDQDAKELKPQVHVVRVDTANALMIQQTLQQMYPRVKVTSTPTTRNNNNQGNQNDNNRGDDNNRDNGRNNNDQQQQQEMIRRIQEMRNQQRGGQQPGSGGIFGGGSNRGGGSRGGDSGNRGGGDRGR